MTYFNEQHIVETMRLTVAGVADHKTKFESKAMAMPLYQFVRQYCSFALFFPARFGKSSAALAYLSKNEKTVLVASGQRCKEIFEDKDVDPEVACRVFTPESFKDFAWTIKFKDIEVIVVDEPNLLAQQFKGHMDELYAHAAGGNKPRTVILLGSM